MWTPSIITEWIDERIIFIQNTLSSTKKINAENQKQISNFAIAVENFKYCKKLYLELCQDSNNDDVKKRFKNIANKLIFETIYELDKVEYHCIYIHGVSFPSKEKVVLPQENIDNILKTRISLENIFYQVQKLCDGNIG